MDLWPHELQRQWEAGQWVTSPNTRGAWRLWTGFSTAGLSHQQRKHIWRRSCCALGAQPTHGAEKTGGNHLCVILAPLPWDWHCSQSQTDQQGTGWSWWVLLPLGSHPLLGDSRSSSGGWSSLTRWELHRRCIGNTEGPALYFSSLLPFRAALDLFPDDSCNTSMPSLPRRWVMMCRVCSQWALCFPWHCLGSHPPGEASTELGAVTAPGSFWFDSTHWHIHGLDGTSVLSFFGNGTLHLPEKKKKFNCLYSSPFLLAFCVVKKRGGSQLWPQEPPNCSFRLFTSGKL